MPYALVENATTVILPIFEGIIPNPLLLPNGDRILGVTWPWASQDGVYSILPVQYDASPENSQETGRSYSVSNGTVQITRAWQALPTAIPQNVTNAQARYVLMQTPSPINQGKTLFDDVDAAVTAGGGIDKMAWEYSNNISRNSTLVASMAGALGMTSTQVDALFIAAAQVTF